MWSFRRRLVKFYALLSNAGGLGRDGVVEHELLDGLGVDFFVDFVVELVENSENREIALKMDKH